MNVASEILIVGYSMKLIAETLAPKEQGVAFKQIEFRVAIKEENVPIARLLPDNARSPLHLVVNLYKN